MRPAHGVGVPRERHGMRRLERRLTNAAHRPEDVMTERKRPKRQTDVDANAPQTDGFSWSESQTGSAFHRPNERRDLDRSGEDGAGVVRSSHS